MQGFVQLTPTQSLVGSRIKTANGSCPDPFFLPHKEKQKSGLASRDYPGAFCQRITIIYIIK